MLFKTVLITSSTLPLNMPYQKINKFKYRFSLSLFLLYEEVSSSRMNRMQLFVCTEYINERMKESSNKRYKRFDNERMGTK
jgi:hypothetical protein